MLHLEKEYDVSLGGKPFEGITSQHAVHKINYLDLLAIELIARLEPESRLEMLRDAFLLLAKSQNDDAACVAFTVVHQHTGTTYGLNRFHLRTTEEEFYAARRSDERTFFDWLQSVYWQLPLFRDNFWERYRNGSLGYTIFEPLQNLKKRILEHVAREIWRGKTDELGIQAMDFLVAHCDSRRFREYALATSEAVRNAHQNHDWWLGRQEVPKKERVMAHDAIRASVPTKINELRPWLAKRKELPESVWKILAHAYVNAGGTFTAK